MLTELKQIKESLVSHPTPKEPEKKQTLLVEFKAFLKQHNLLGLVVAIIIALFLAALIKSLVDNLLIFIVMLFIPGTLEKLALSPFRAGAFIADFITVILTALVIILFIKLIKRYGIDWFFSFLS